jgi:hypothetical protein
MSAHWPVDRELVGLDSTPARGDISTTDFASGDVG